MVLEERNPAPPCHQDGCASFAIPSGPFKTVNRGGHFSICHAGIKMNARSRGHIMRFEAVAHNVSCDHKQAHRKFLAKHLFISTELQILILPAAYQLLSSPNEAFLSFVNNPKIIPNL